MDNAIDDNRITDPWGVTGIRIASYNLHNLFLAGEGPVKPAKQVRPLARMIEQVDADVLVVQEAGSTASLEALNQRLAQPYPVCEVVPGNSNRSIHLGVLARVPVRLKSHRDVQLLDQQGRPLEYYADDAAAAARRTSPLGFFRDLLRVELDAGAGRPLALFGVHLKSRTNQPWQLHAADVMRQAECRAICTLIGAYRRRHADALIALLGDFNDLLSSAALAPLKSLGLHDPLGEQLRRAGRNPATYWPKRRMRIDHILVSAELRRWALPDGAVIHISHMARTASDHYPVSLMLDSSGDVEDS